MVRKNVSCTKPDWTDQQEFSKSITLMLTKISHNLVTASALGQDPVSSSQPWTKKLQ